MKIYNLNKCVVLFVLLSFLACSHTDVYKDTNMDFGAIQRVAVMPFANFSRDNQAASRVRDVFITMLMATSTVYVIPTGEVSSGILKTGMTDSSAPSEEEIKRFANIVNADAVITGVVKEYGEVRSGSTPSNIISISMQMIEKDSANVVWSASSTKGGVSITDRLFGGGGVPINDITEDAINEILDKLFQ
ncbi:MAG: DUF799 family lipoprotein [Candidatus Schekmanbacteria bacterium]|nr:DUF799 family lipoprotein [Candidatus Schekmanbacteria bacterium]